MFTARDRDPDTGLYNYRYRYYSPSLGRFVQVDPIRLLGGFNLYGYVHNSPVNHADVLGLITNKLLGPDGTSYDVDPSTGLYSVPGQPLDGRALANLALSALAVGAAPFIAADLGPEAGLLYLATILNDMGERNRSPKFCATKTLTTPKVTDPNLSNIVRDLYKGAEAPNPIGTGSTADAIRNELATESPTYGTFHSVKGEQYISALNNWLGNNPNASDYDSMVARSLKADLESALRGK
jgi:RHS repeat-associated protein